MKRLTKVYGHDGGDSFYFINGVRSDAYDDTSALQELLGDDFQEIWLASDYVFETEDQDEAMASLESAETLSDFEAILNDYPELVVEV